MFVKVHPDLARAALRESRDREYRLWSLARTLDVDGSGRVRVADLQQFADGLKLCGLSAGTVGKLLRAGDGVFWTVYRNDGEPWVRLHGLASVCVALDVKKLRSDPVLLPMRYTRSLRAWRSALYGSQFGNEWSNPISRQTLEALTDVRPRTQRHYARALGSKLESRQNAARTGEQWSRGDDIPDDCFPDYVDDELVLLRRLPNSYRCKLQRGARGMMRRVNSELNARHSPRLCGGEARTRSRLFYDDTKAAMRRLEGMAEQDQFYVQTGRRRVQRSRCGAALWSHWMVVDGRAFFS